MENKNVGAIFCFMSAVLISARYISAAIFMSGVASWNATLFAAGLEYVGPFLAIAAGIAFIIGILFLGYGLYQDIKTSLDKGTQRKTTENELPSLTQCTA